MGDGNYIDARQLRVLLTLLEQRSVTRAARILDQSQPHVSLTLKRLRQATGDPILVRSGSELVLTERGHGMIEPARAALAGIEQIVSRPPAFDPSNERGTFRIASGDCMETLVLPRLVERIQRLAPFARLVIHAVDRAFDYATAFQRDDLDALISNWTGAPDHLRSARLLSDDTVCVFSPDHSFASKDRITIADYLAAEHVAPVARSRADPGPIDSRLSARGLERRIGVMVPEFSLIPHVLMLSNLVFTSSRSFADHFCALLPLRSLPAPAECGKLDFYLLWHERSHASERTVWLRRQIMAVAKSLRVRPDHKPSLIDSICSTDLPATSDDG